MAAVDLKLYQIGTFAAGNRLLGEDQQSVQAGADRANSITSGHRACQGCGEALGARFVLDAAQGMTVHAVVELVRAAASAEGATISHSLVRMLTKLATHASGDPSARSRAADGAISADQPGMSSSGVSQSTPAAGPKLRTCQTVCRRAKVSVGIPGSRIDGSVRKVTSRCQTSR